MKINIDNSNHLEKKETNISIILYSRREQLMQKKSHLILEYVLYTNLASLMAQTVKSLPAMEETQVQSLGQEDPLEKEMATHFSILAWRIPWTKEPGGLQFMCRKESDMTEKLTLFFSLKIRHKWSRQIQVK